MENGKSILQILWRVEATALALSLAVVSFILDAVNATRWRLSKKTIAIVRYPPGDHGVGRRADAVKIVVAGLVSFDPRP